VHNPVAPAASAFVYTLRNRAEALLFQAEIVSLRSGWPN
jgi:hypothetical protein